MVFQKYCPLYLHEIVGAERLLTILMEEPSES